VSSKCGLWYEKPALMPQYELSIDPALVAEAEQLVTLEGRTFPTLCVMWDSQTLGQDWQTVLVLDYTIPLPPLEVGKSFNEVRIAAYTGAVPTKFLYFGTELNASVPRVAPEMENTVGPTNVYQEYRLTEDTCTVPYLDLISSTPRIYGNGPQDYYSPPIKVERFDAGSGLDLIADNFPSITAAMPPISSAVLTDPRGGHWQGARFVGTKRIAILRQGQVVGLRRRASEKEIIPPEVVRRDPGKDVRDAWVAIDLGMTGTVIAVGNGEGHEYLRIGASEEPKLPRDFETPSEISFINLPRIIKAWRDRVVLPLTAWGDVLVGHGARERLAVAGKERAQRLKATVSEIGALPARLDRGEKVRVCGRNDLDNVATLEPPAPPVFDEEGISPNDPFDPLELFFYYIGLFVNERRRGIHLRYALGMPTGWPPERRQQVLGELRRGVLRSLPAGMVAFDDLDTLQVVDAGPNVLAFAAYAFKVFGLQPKGDDPIRFVAIDAGASETSVLCGMFRKGSPDEVSSGYERIVEHVEPTILDTCGEALLHRMAYKVYAASNTSMKTNDVPFEPPPGEDPLEGAENRLNSTLDARTNVRLLKDYVRPIMEKPGPSPMPDMVQLLSSDGRVRDVRIMIDRAALGEWLRGQLSELALRIKEAIVKGFQQVTRAATPFNDMRVLLGGRLGLHAFLQERLEAVLPPGVRVHKFREPDHTNLLAPTVKLATALGILALRYQPMAPAAVSDERSTFKYRVGRARQGKLHAVLDSSAGYDVWREMGACTKPEVTVLYVGGDGPEVGADDPSVQRVIMNLGYDAVGYRIYLRAVGGSKIELSIGPPSGRPDADAPCWQIDLAVGAAEPVSRRG
jgi:hypothetical protein